MADQDTATGNNRVAYKVVALFTMWVDDGPEHEAMKEISKQIVSHELADNLDGAGFRIGDTEYTFETAVNSIEFVTRSELN
jgi:hypothetical protein